MTIQTTTDDDQPADDGPLTDHERALLRYVAGLAEHVGLRDWEVVVKRGETEEHVIAHAEIAYGRRVVTVTLGPKFFEDGPEEQRSTAVHELLHAHLDGPAAVVRDLETQMGTWLYEVVYETYKRANETATDSLAVVLARHLPMPPPPPPDGA